MAEDRSQLSDGYHTFAELYRERSALTAALARMAAWQEKQVGQPAGRFAGVLHDDQPGFDGFRTVLYIWLPAGQVSWHFSDADAAEFLKGVPPFIGSYDGHDTPTKYDRLEEFARTPLS